MSSIRRLHVPSLLLLFLCLCKVLNVFAALLPEVHHPRSNTNLLVRQDQINTNETAPLLADATTDEIEEARRVVKAAIEESSKLNKARLDHPARNVYKLAPGTVVGANGRVKRGAEDEQAPPLLTITPEIAAAAALVAEANAKANYTAGAAHSKRETGTFWM